MSKIALSIVTAAYNEADNLRPLVSAIVSQCRLLEISFEILVVDDGSRDRSAQVLEELRAEHPELGSLHLERNEGHQAALIAGIRHARGNHVVTLDADLQHPPDQIPAFWRVVSKEPAVDLVQAQRQRASSDEPRLKRLLAFAFYALMRLFSRRSLIPHAADFRCIGPRIIHRMHQDPRSSFFLRAFCVREAEHVRVIPFTVARRNSGDSKYSWRKQFQLALSACIELQRPLFAARIVFFAASLVLPAAVLPWLVLEAWVRNFEARSRRAIPRSLFYSPREVVPLPRAA